MNQKRFFSPAEWEILQFITARQAATGREVADHFATTRGWARTTVITMIERLRDKGYLLRDESGSVHRYAPSEPKADLMRSLVRDFVQKALGGSVSPFVAYLGDEANLSEEEVAELRRVLSDLDSTQERDDA
jgi:predicted transcriptional regulator